MGSNLCVLMGQELYFENLLKYYLSTIMHRYVGLSTSTEVRKQYLSTNV